jgi:hypothetical protein
MRGLTEFWWRMNGPLLNLPQFLPHSRLNLQTVLRGLDSMDPSCGRLWTLLCKLPGCAALAALWFVKRRVVGGLAV